ncbi:hypothetical protein [Massilia sp. BJB1822]|uniref:hypothetical protein n=1 Tax=Massilia sp. BJB1822 TaxID=2744470 RepID=UPI0015944811|nr:hypothetical protein [Massilia sp. BJB1822]NVD97978.1 hypothetical protein [Massilia sp. BJB1822]
MDAHRIEIERFKVTCLVAQDQPRPERLRDRIAEVAAGIGAALGSSLAPLFDAHGDGVCLIRRMELDLALDADAGEPQQRAAWARQIAASVARRLAGVGDGIARFASRAAQLAHFLDRLAAGDAWSLWYHRQYAGLRALPDAMAARTALLADGAAGLASLQSMDGWSRQRLLVMLGEAECRRVLEGFAADGAPCRDAGRVIAETLPGCRTPPAHTNAAALELYLALSAASGKAPDRDRAMLVRAVAGLRAAVARGETGLAEALANATPPALVRRVVDALGPGAADMALALQALPAAERAQLARAMDAPGVPRAVEYTLHGGVFLLLDGLETVMPSNLAAWPDCVGAHAGMPAAQALRLLVLANGLGPELAPQVLEDTLWRALFAVPPRLNRRDLAEWSAALPPALLARWTRELRVAPLPAWPPAPAKVARVLGRASHALLRRFARRLPGFTEAGPQYLRSNFLCTGARAEYNGDSLAATLARAPLDVILAMSTLSATTLQLDWLAPPVIHLRRGDD